MLDYKEFKRTKDNYKLVSKLGDEWENWFINNHPNVKIGCTFTVEKCIDQELALKSFEYCLSELNLKHIRFPLRWNSIEQTEGNLDLSLYEPFFKMMEKYDGLEICLNLGPIKTTDWPETHVPSFIAKDFQKIPTWPFELPIDHPLVDISSQYLHQLCQKLKQELNPKILTSINQIQLNNEAFNPFGEPKIVLSPETELHFAKIANTYFKNQQFLFNSAGRLQVNKILKTLKLFEEYGFGKNTLGIDYYYHTPLNKNFPNFEPLGVSLPHNMSMKRLLKKLSKEGYVLEFTELQMEKWGEISHPGKDPNSLKFALARVADYLPINQNNLILRLWGVENFAHRIITDRCEGDELEMARIVKAISTKSESIIM